MAQIVSPSLRFRLGLAAVACFGMECRSVEVVDPPVGSSSSGQGGADVTASSASASGTGGGVPCTPGDACDPFHRVDRFAGGGNQQAEAIAFDAKGDVVVAGSFHGDLLIGADAWSAHGLLDGFVAKLDGKTASPLWSRGFGGSGDERATGVACDASGNSYVAGVASSPIDLGDGPLCSDGGRQVFLAKLDASGLPIFARCFGAPDQYTGTWASISATSDGGVVLIVEANDEIDFGSGPVALEHGSLAIARFDAAGESLWARTVGESFGIHPGAVDASQPGSIYLSGTFYDPIIFADDHLTPDGQDQDSFVAALDDEGHPRWARAVRTLSGAVEGPGIHADLDGGLLVTANAFTSIDDGRGARAGSGTVARLNASGGVAWTSDMGVSQVGGARVVEDASGRAVVFGNGPPLPPEQGWGEMWLAGFDSQGTRLFVEDHGSGWAAGMAIHDQELAFTGIAVGAIDFGSGPVLGDDHDGDGFVALVSPWLPPAP